VDERGAKTWGKEKHCRKKTKRGGHEDDGERRDKGKKKIGVGRELPCEVKEEKAEITDGRGGVKLTVERRQFCRGYAKIGGGVIKTSFYGKKGVKEGNQ